MAAELGAKYIATMPPDASVDGLLIPSFQSIGADILTITNSATFGWFTVVENVNRSAFEAAAVVAAQKQDPSGALAAQASVGITLKTDSGAFFRAPTAPFYFVRGASVPVADQNLVMARLQDIYAIPTRTVRATGTR